MLKKIAILLITIIVFVLGFSFGTRWGVAIDGGFHTSSRISLAVNYPSAYNKVFPVILNGPDDKKFSFFRLIKHDLAFLKVAEHCGALHTVLSEREIAEFKLLRDNVKQLFPEDCVQNGLHCADNMINKSYIMSGASCDSLTTYGNFVSFFDSLSETESN